MPLDGPRLKPRLGPAKQLVVLLHGYGSDGNDLIALGQQWQRWLPDAAFVAPPPADNVTDPFVKPFLEQIESGARTMRLDIHAVVVRSK